MSDFDSLVARLCVVPSSSFDRGAVRYDSFFVGNSSSRVYFFVVRGKAESLNHLFGGNLAYGSLENIGTEYERARVRKVEENPAANYVAICVFSGGGKIAVCISKVQQPASSVWGEKEEKILCDESDGRPTSAPSLSSQR